jgi:threonine/homoserine/homoserine lactone efflux protein
VPHLTHAFLFVGASLALLMTPGPAVDVEDRGPNDLHGVFMRGVIVNVLNPHTALFFFAFLPQFVNPSSGHVPLQMMTLGLLFVGLSAITDSGWAIAAGAAGQWIKSHPRFARGQRFLTGGALIGLGATAALTGTNRK